MLPASAGMIPLRGVDAGDGLRAPRICGDDPYGLSQFVGTDQCSPHLRG